jgi:hypothetical protein
VTIPTNLTLSGNGSYVFKITGTFKPTASVILTNGAQASDIVWAVSGATEIGAGAVVNGTILDWTSIAMDAGATLNGGAFGITQAVTLIDNTVTVPAALDEYGIGYGYGYDASGAYTAPTYATPVPVTGISLNESSAILIAGNTDQLTATITPASSTNPGVIWTSNNSSVASVNSTGLVTALTAGGPVTITATAMDTTNGTLAATDSIIVNSANVSSGGGGGGGGGGCSGNCGATSGGNSVSTPSGATSVTLSGLETQLLNLLIKELKVVLLQAQAQGMVLTSAETAFLNGSSLTVSTPSAITRDLTVGSRGSDVSTLQTFLISQAKGSAASALGAAGATGYFGQLTKGSLAEYQAAVGIAPPQGYFGSITRAYLKNAGF